MSIFKDRVDAGRQLGRRLAELRGQDIVVLGLPRGGVPVAFEVAAALDAPLDVIVVRKLGLPYQPELAMGAVGEGGVKVLDEQVLAHSRVSGEELLAVESTSVPCWKTGWPCSGRAAPGVDLTGRIAVIVDDGIATGSTARVACRIARKQGAARVILAVPVAPAETLADLSEPMKWSAWRHRASSPPSATTTGTSRRLTTTRWCACSICSQTPGDRLPPSPTSAAARQRR